MYVRDGVVTPDGSICFLFKKGIHGKFMYYKRILIDIYLKEELES